MSDLYAELVLWRGHADAAEHHRSELHAGLRAARERTGLSLRVAAERAGLSPAALSGAERGNSFLATHSVKRVLDVYRQAGGDDA